METVRALVSGTGRLQLIADCQRGIDTLMVHKLRSLLTMLGMIFGVAAVVSMMSIGAGAQQQVLAFIEQLGVRNLIVEANEATNFQSFQKVPFLRALAPTQSEAPFAVAQLAVLIGFLAVGVLSLKRNSSRPAIAVA